MEVVTQRFSFLLALFSTVEIEKSKPILDSKESCPKSLLCQGSVDQKVQGLCDVLYVISATAEGEIGQFRYLVRDLTFWPEIQRTGQPS